MTVFHIRLINLQGFSGTDRPSHHRHDPATHGNEFSGGDAKTANPGWFALERFDERGIDDVGTVHARSHATDPLPVLQLQADDAQLSLTLDHRWLQERPLLHADLYGEIEDMRGLGLQLRLLAQ